MPAVFIRFAASMKNGIASRRNELYDFSISFNSRNGVSRSSMKNTGTQASPSANATGTRRMIRTAKIPNRIAATSAGPIDSTPERLQIVDDPLKDEQEPADPGKRPRDMDRQHVDAGHLRMLLVAEQREAPAEGDEDQRDQQDRHVDDEPRDRLAAGGLGRWQHVDVEVRAVADRNGGAQHDQPHQAEAGDFLRPDVARDEVEEAREDLQRHRDEHHCDQHGDQLLDAAVDQGVERAHRSAAGTGKRRAGSREKRIPAATGPYRSANRVDLVQDVGRVDFLGVRLLYRLGQLEQLGPLGERPRLELAFLLQLGEQRRVATRLEIAAVFARFLSGL